MNATTGWNQIETPFFLIRYHPGEERLDRLAHQLERAYERVSRLLGCRLSGIEVVVCGSYEELWLTTLRRPRSLLSVRDDTLVCLSLDRWAETWGKIYARPYRSQDGDEETLFSLLTHELCHVFCYRLLGAEGFSHRWFLEGLADYAAGRGGRVANVLQEARRRDLFFSDLEELDRAFEWAATGPGQWDRTWIAYAQSWAMMTFLLAGEGQGRVRLFFQRAQAGEAGFERLFCEAFGQTPGALLRDWLSRQGV